MSDEFSRFDPKAHWATVNNEEMEFSNYEKQVKERQESILAALSTGPKTAQELADITQLKKNAVASNIKYLRRKGCEIEGDRSTGRVIYCLISRPNVLKNIRGRK